jgi:beta-lactamase superfamily II metal-dependent hydrolase
MRRVTALLVALFVATWAPSLRTQQAERPLRIHFVDVGQGDAVLIQSPLGPNVVYDSGESPSRMREYLSSVGVSQVGLVIASHNHADHIGGLAEVMRQFRPSFYMDNGIPATTQTYARLLEAVSAAGSGLLAPTNRRIFLADGVLQVIPPPGIPDWDQNDNSIGIILEYGRFRLSLMGDAEPREWAWWRIHQPSLFAPPVQVHKASHHGSINGDTAEGVMRLAPNAVVISAGLANSYGHPDPEALALYRTHGATTYRTDVQGTVIIEAQLSGAYTVRVGPKEGAEPPPTPPRTPTPAPAPL